MLISRRLSVPIATIVAFVVLTCRTADGQSLLQLVQVTDVRLDAAQRLVDFTIENKTDRIVTAWFVAAHLKYPDGVETAGDVYGVDSYRSAAGLVTSASHLDPATRLTKQFTVGFRRGMTPQQAEVVPIALVFSDGTSVGEERYLARVFETRDQDRSALELVLKTLEDAVRMKGNNLDAIKLAFEMLDSPIPAERQNHIVQSNRKNLELARALVERGQAQPGPRLQLLISDARRQLIAAREHSSRKP